MNSYKKNLKEVFKIMLMAFNKALRELKTAKKINQELKNFLLGNPLKFIHPKL